MAFTSIWSVKGYLGSVVVYIENPDKTENPDYYEQQSMTAQQAQGLFDVIHYASQTRKTQVTDENTEILRHYVTGINCRPDTARDEMMAAKKKFGKNDGVIAYHGIQSFAPGEANPDMAHEIGVKLAMRLWGDRHQVIVATHLDKANHLHSHFVVNTVSWIDGKRYHRTEQDYYDMRTESDKLCREYGLSVIDNPTYGKSKHYSEWQAERNNEPTYRSLIREIVDCAIAESMSEQQFFYNLRKQGCFVKVGKDITVRPPGKDRGLKLVRNFGEAYTIESIRERILSQCSPKYTPKPSQQRSKKVLLVGSLNTAKKAKGFRALYLHYMYLMGVLPKKKRRDNRKIHFLFREDIIKLNKLSKEIELLVKKRIDTSEQLSAFRTNVEGDIASLIVERNRLQRSNRNTSNPEEKLRITDISKQLRTLCEQLSICNRIFDRAKEMRVKLETVKREENNIESKEGKDNERFRRRR